MRLIKKLASLSVPKIEDKDEAILSMLADGLQPDADLNFLDFCNSKVIIPKATGAKHYGQYSSKFTPHVETIINALDVDSGYKRIALMGASQLFKTQTSINYLLYIVDQHPSNILFLSPTGELKRRLVNRLDKTIESHDFARNKFANPKSHTDPNNSSIKSFIGGTLFLGSANSPSTLSEVPAKVILGDEIDRWNDNVAGEGSPISLAEKRATSFGNDAKFFFFSSPTVKGKSKIDALFQKGTKQEALAECIECKHPQELIFEELKLDEQGQAYYPCKECGFVHYEHHKAEMFKNGLWTSPKDFDGETASFHINALFMPYGGFSWTALMMEYLEAKQETEKTGSSNLMRAFLNTRLANVYSDEDTFTTADKLIERAEDYKLGIVPSRGTFVICSVDVQETRFECATWAFSYGLECWAVDYTVIYGSPDDKETQKQLLDYLTREVPHESGQKMKPITSFIDSGGHFTKEIYAFCHRNKAHKIIPIKGSSNPNADPIKNATKTKIEGTNQTLLLYVLGVNQTKNTISTKLSKQTGVGMIHFSKYLPTSFFEGLVSEYKETVFYRGKPSTRWVKKIGEANEPLDLLTYAMCAAYKNAIHRMSEGKIESVRKKLQLDAKKKHIEEIEETIEAEVEIDERLPPPKKSKIKRKQGTSFSKLW